MVGPTYSAPPGTVLHFPDGHTVTLTPGEHVTVPAGTILESRTAGAGPPQTLLAGTVIATGSAPAPTPTATGRPAAPVPTASLPPTGQRIKPVAWEHTKEAVALQDGYTALRAAYVTTLPGLRTQLELIANRPIGG